MQSKKQSRNLSKYWNIRFDKANISIRNANRVFSIVLGKWAAVWGKIQTLFHLPLCTKIYLKWIKYLNA